jgi:hypothetical protein
VLNIVRKIKTKNPPKKYLKKGVSGITPLITKGGVRGDEVCEKYAKNLLVFIWRTGVFKYCHLHICKLE